MKNQTPVMMTTQAVSMAMSDFFGLYLSNIFHPDIKDQYQHLGR